MSLAPRLDLRQSQSLVMTPQLQQAIRLLALSNLEVEAFIAEEIEKNPLLEANSPGAGEEDGGRDSGEGEGAFDPDDPPRDGPADAAELLQSGGDAGEAQLDVDFAADTFHHDSPSDAIGGLDGGLGLAGGASGGASEDGPDFDSFAQSDLSLADHLLAQAGAAIAGPDLFIAAHLIDQIDETGYLTEPLLDIANRLSVPLARVEAVLAIIQTFDPTGVGARDLAECLALQAKEADRYDPCMARLIDNLDLVARGQLAQLKRICGVDDEDMADMIRELRNYDPKPGCRYGGEPSQAVVPDLFVARRGDGWAIEINSATLPRVLVNRTYYAELSGTARRDKASRAWLSDCLASANWLVKALDQRQRTIIKVATEIVKQQEAFFLHGVAHLRPLTLARVAEAIEMHESTVSRVTSNKYLSCARGLFELKYFFTSAIQSADGGDAVSAEAVKNAIRSLIAAEDAKAILSDDTLVDLLRGKGFDIARRTVAKYREAMGIGSSVQRRRQKALQGAGHSA
ncbi:MULTISPECIES: RNA polymerase factor sigma-54 [unclassified Sphingomonas]|jgi:RNA polymerase sigma-54 factor|uniref:RNA polymerase factor sigma-54 n=1 Tax=unclassified Sphingomonas TaxID=196159 RepID=UPI000833EC96|nr:MULTISPECIES: RNA polymerase factor sigma-54 [unclassified Sphingomonas]